MTNVLVIGSNGQVGSELQAVSKEYNYNFFFVSKETLNITDENDVKNFEPVKIHTWIFPMFPTDLQAPFAILQLVTEWKSEIFETLFEKRLNFLFELEQMKANVQILNPHQAIIFWWKKWTFVCRKSEKFKKTRFKLFSEK